MLVLAPELVLEREEPLGAVTGGGVLFIAPPDFILLELDELEPELTPDPMVPPERIWLEELDELEPELIPDPMVPPERIWLEELGA